MVDKLLATRGIKIMMSDAPSSPNGVPWVTDGDVWDQSHSAWTGADLIVDVFATSYFVGQIPPTIIMRRTVDLRARQRWNRKRRHRS